MKRGLVFNIQRFCLQDGPGIRTVVFFKGCPLRCKWCSNPESQSRLPEIMYFSRLCQGCFTCVDVCPNKAIVASTKDKKISINKKKCDSCGICEANCKANALRLAGKYYTSDELLDIIIKDKNYFDLSDGGVTFSGGEPLLQSSFLESILIKLQFHNIKVAIETAGYFDKGVLNNVAKYTDIFLFDIKHITNKKHVDGTGKGNSKILSNLKYLSNIHNNIVARIPIIPEYNMNKNDLEAMLKIIAAYGITNVQFIPYHNYGLSKYQSIGKDYELLHLKEPKDMQLQKLKRSIRTDLNIEILSH